MDKPDSPATDEALSRPVSSLRSHFEALKSGSAPVPVPMPVPAPILPPKTDALRRSPATPLLPLVAGSPTVLPPRVSSDFVRPAWAGSPSDSHDDSAVGIKRRSVSPPKSHRHQLSLAAPASPRMTPSFRVDSPSPPPRQYGFPSSPALDGVDATPYSKVRELISQHSSRTASPIPISPRPDKAPVPPPVNRSDKPKIQIPPILPKSPALVASTVHTPVTAPVLVPTPSTPKQVPVAALSASPNLQPIAPRASFEAPHISPFSTPPSSDENGSPLPSPGRMHTFPQSLNQRAAPTAAAGGEKTKEDARFLGFQRPAAPPAERRDPRTLGFGQPASGPPSRDVSLAPTRASTVSERPYGRDARTFGYSQPDRPQQRHVSDNLRSRSPVVSNPAQPIKIGQSRDARTLGFGGSAASNGPATEEASPAARPRRPTIRAPAPPRLPDTMSTAPQKLRQPSPAPPDRSTKPSVQGAPVMGQVPTQQHFTKAAVLPSEQQFPPPPKRNTSESERAADFRTRAGRAVAYDSDSDDIDTGAPAGPEPTPGHRTEYPDGNQSNRRPPLFRTGLQGVQFKSESRAYDVCGTYLCVGGFSTKVFDIVTGEQLSGINHGETIRASAVCFKPAADVASEGKRIWIGTNAGDLQEVDVMTHSLIAENSSHNKCEIVRILRRGGDLWTLDSEGKLFVWPADESGVPNLKYSHVTHRVPKGHTFSLVVRDNLWLATGKEVRVYRPGSEANFAPLSKVLSQPGTGDITSGTWTEDEGGRVYFGHADGRVTVYSTKDYTCVGNIKASDYKINGLAISGTSLWAAYKTGKIYVYDVTKSPWKVQKDWRAHAGPIIGLTLDPKSIWTMQRLQLTSIGHDGQARFWDGLLEEDWIEHSLQDRELSYCSFREIRAAVVTWNCGACTPHELRTDFIADAIHSDDPPEILAFGFQEVVDLEDRAVTAKSIFGFGKKKDVDSTEQHQSRVYREWRDYLSKLISRYTGGQYTYSELHTSSLIGLFQCIFIRQEERPRLRNMHATNIKCGMKGRYGNKGGLVTRFIIDDTSLCFINCHLAAGQTQTSHRNNDLATILESENLAQEPSVDERISLFTGGGDGTQILDHEICILNGDLNYRIDTVPRDTVIKMIKANDIGKLLERDQIMLSRRRVSGFRLSSFVESPITFAPTYKYDVGTDNYDTSEKKRAPAWCDRILFRGPGRVKQLEYRRHEVKASDHRPVSGLFKIRLKTVDAAKRAIVKKECEAAFAQLMKARMKSVAETWLVNEYGLSRQEAASALGIV